MSFSHHSVANYLQRCSYRGKESLRGWSSGAGSGRGCSSWRYQCSTDSVIESHRWCWNWNDMTVVLLITLILSNSPRERELACRSTLPFSCGGCILIQLPQENARVLVRDRCRTYPGDLERLLKRTGTASPHGNINVGSMSCTRFQTVTFMETAPYNV